MYKPTPNHFIIKCKNQKIHISSTNSFIEKIYQTNKVYMKNDKIVKYSTIKYNPSNTK
jgi:hypothetical protein